MKSNDRKNFVWNTIGSTVNSFSSLFFMIIVTRLNGIKNAGVFTFAFSFAILVQVIGNYFGRSYQVTNLDESISDSDFVYSRFFTCFLMLICSFIFVLFKGYYYEKCIVILLLVLFRMIESFGEILYGILQKNGRLYLVGISMFLKASFSIFIFFVIDFFFKNFLLAILSISIVNLFFVLFYDYANVKKNNFKLLKFKRNIFMKILVGGFFVFLFTILTQYVLNASKYSIDNYMGDKYQTIFGIIVMPATVMALCSQFFVQPFLSKISLFLKNCEYDNFSKLIYKLSMYVFCLGFLATIFCYFFGIPILEIIYGLRLIKYKYSLILIIIGSIFFGISYVFSNALISLRKNFSQTLIYGFTAVFSFFTSNFLVKYYGVFGASFAYFVSMLVLFILYFLVFLHYKKELYFSYDSGDHTFVVLAYKESPFLEDCIKSVINQSVKSHVVIATTTENDYIKNIASRYNLELIIGKHTSIGGDFDFAISCGKSSLVTVAHQDDIYESNYVSEILKNYYFNKDSIILFSDYYEIRNNKNIYFNKNLLIKKVLLTNLLLKKISGIKFLKRNVLRFGCSICCPSVTFVKSNIPNKIFESDLKCDVDWYAWEKLSRRNGKFIYINKKLMGHRIDESTTTTDIINKGIRTKEDLVILKKFWPSFAANFINKYYKKSEESNRMVKK